MKKLFHKIGRFFWSWGFLKFVLWAITIIVLFYVEEDWRGARAWAATKAEWEAKGESFDFNKFIPPPVPEEQNLAALPLFKQEQVRGDDGTPYLAPVALQKAMRSRNPGYNLPKTGNWQKGELPDMAKIKSAIAADYGEAFPGVTPPTNVLDQFHDLYPFVADLRSAAIVRRQFRLDSDYSTSPPMLRPLGSLTAQILLSQILKIDAVLALDQQKPDVVLADIKLNLQLIMGEKQDPTLVAGLVAIGMTAIFNPVIGYGLALHSWSDAQLADLQNSLAQLDFLSAYQFSMRGEVVVESIPNFDYMKKVGGRDLIRLWTGMSDQSEHSLLESALPSPMASGWLDQNKRQMVDSILTSVHGMDPVSHRVFPDQVDDGMARADQDKARTDTFAPWNILARISDGPLLHAVIKFAQAQTWVDEARIAIALERYRLVHNAYPESLDALAPACIPEVPHDIINGQPYQYRLQPDGSFLLYSVGWNQVDDGGKVVYQKESSTAVDYSQGDWAWPTLKAAQSKSP